MPRYAVWVTHVDGQLDEHAPRLVRTPGRLQFGDKLPLANVDCWITQIEEGEWLGEDGQVYDARAWAAAGPTNESLARE